MAIAKQQERQRRVEAYRAERAKAKVEALEAINVKRRAEGLPDVIDPNA